jgi:hypothetical protein
MGRRKAGAGRKRKCQPKRCSVQLDRADVEAIAAELEAAARPGSNSQPRLSVDLQDRTVTTPSGRRIDFKVDGIRRDSLLKGLNEVALTLTRGRTRSPPIKRKRVNARRGSTPPPDFPALPSATKAMSSS